jgi:uncharacterized protein (TIGR02217 family)
MTYPYTPTRGLIATPSLASDPDVFPNLSGVNFLAQKSPQFQPAVKRTAVSGRQIRSRIQSAATWAFEVSFEFLRDGSNYNELQNLIGFYTAHLGSLGTWFYWDVYDNAVPAIQFGTADGATKAFQLVRQYAPNTPSSFVENVYAVRNPVVMINGVSTTAYTIGAYGILTFDTPPPAGAILTWSGNFLFLCHFTEESLKVTQLMQGLWEGKSIKFESWRP